ncbi:DUF2567 domain-containing protein [Rhodococcus sp. 3Y1]
MTGESLHQFDASAVFIWLALIVGVLSAVAAWLARLSRGPYALGGLIVGSVAGTGLMALVGSGVTKLRFPTADNPAVGRSLRGPRTSELCSCFCFSRSRRAS